MPTWSSFERPETGDDGRAWGPPFWEGEGTMFLSANANKRSLAISLRDPRGRDAILRLAESADVFVQSLRPGLAETSASGWTTSSTNPRLVYCSVGAYGHKGPQSGEAGYDALMQAAGGLISITGEPGRPGVRVGSSLIDQGTGTWAALGILAALLERERRGEGAVVDVSLDEPRSGRSATTYGLPRTARSRTVRTPASRCSRQPGAPDLVGLS